MTSLLSGKDSDYISTETLRDRIGLITTGPTSDVDYEKPGASICCMS